VALMVGGRAAHGYRERLPELPIHWVHSLGELDQILVKIASGG